MTAKTFNTKAVREAHADRIALVKTCDGYKTHRIAPLTGTLVVLWDANEQGMDVSPYRWALTCEDHGCILGSPTRSHAFAFMTEVSEWCGTCQWNITHGIPPYMTTEDLQASTTYVSDEDKAAQVSEFKAALVAEQVETERETAAQMVKIHTQDLGSFRWNEEGTRAVWRFSKDISKWVTLTDRRGGYTPTRSADQFLGTFRLEITASTVLSDWWTVTTCGTTGLGATRRHDFKTLTEATAYALKWLDYRFMARALEVAS